MLCLAYRVIKVSRKFIPLLRERSSPLAPVFPPLACSRFFLFLTLYHRLLANMFTYIRDARAIRDSYRNIEIPPQHRNGGTRDKRLEEINTDWKLIAFYFFLLRSIAPSKLTCYRMKRNNCNFNEAACGESSDNKYRKYR